MNFDYSTSSWSLKDKEGDAQGSPRKDYASTTRYGTEYLISHMQAFSNFASALYKGYMHSYPGHILAPGPNVVCLLERL